MIVNWKKVEGNGIDDGNFYWFYKYVGELLFGKIYKF